MLTVARTPASVAAAGALPTLGVFVTLVSVGLLIALLVLYLQAYRRMKTPFGLGILVFVLVLLAQNLLQVLLALERAGGTIVVSVNSAAFLSDVLELGGLSVLLYLATQ
ncbi:MAG: hypothetical protein ACYDDF_08795 [Thermoplasmatota archaeon]